MTNKNIKHPIIVIGAGVGGLSAALTLLAKGYRVTLLEQQPHPGGKLHQVAMGEHLIDSGPTVFTMRWVFDQLFELAGSRLEDEVQLFRSEHLARHSWEDSPSLDLFSDVERSATAIQEFAGASEAENYRKFAAHSERVFTTLDATFMRTKRPNLLQLSFGHGLGHAIRMAQIQPMVTLWDSLGKTFSDPRLVQLFARYSTYCGSSPYRAPATLMLIAHAERSGVYQLKGGMQSLAKAMANRIEKLGGELRFGCAVERIETQNKKVTGVVLADTTRIDADAIVFNGDTQALTRGLLGPQLTRSTAKRQEPSLSALTRCLVGNVTGFDLAYHTVFFGSDYRDEFNSIFKRNRPTDNPTVYICAQERGPAFANSDRAQDQEKLFCLINAPASQSQHELSAEAIENAQTAMLKTLHAHGLELHTRPELSTLTTADDFAQRFPGSDGALYGNPTHGWLGSFKRPGSRSRIAGLYLAGGGVHPGAGLPMVSMSGQLAAAALAQDFQ